VSIPPNQLPPPPPTQPPEAASPTQIVGQQSAPTTAVPIASGMPQYSGVMIAGQKTNQLAIISLVTALVAPLGHLVGIGGITLIIVSLVTGHMARSQIRQTGEGGANLALVGLIISYAHLVISAILLIIFFGAIVAFFGLLFHAGAG
jgi:hypothetical protein